MAPLSSHLRRRTLSRRFLAPEDGPDLRQQRLRASGALFAEGQWPAIRVQLESQGWNATQIDLVHEQLRRGWPLPMARRHVAQISGHCPLGARHDV